MPRAAHSLRASSAGSWPGSSLSGRLLTMVFTPDAASASMLSALKAPAAVKPGESGIRGGIVGIDRLRKAKRAAKLQPGAVRSNSCGGSGGVLPRTLHQIAGADPEALEPAQGHGRGLQIVVVDRGLVQHLDMARVHGLQPVAQLRAFLGQPHMNRATVVHRALLRKIAVLDHL